MSEGELIALVRRLFLRGDQSFPLAADTDLVGEGICDSLGLVQLATALEDGVPGLRVADQDVTRENLGSVAAIARFLGGRAE